MDIAPLSRIDCILLHETDHALPTEELRRRVTAVLATAGLDPVEDPAGAGGSGQAVAFRAGHWHIRVRFTPAPLARESLRHTLSQPYTRTIFPEAEKVIEAHAAHTLVSLEKRAAPSPLAGEAQPFTHSKEIMPAMSLVALLARELMSRQPAVAIYWAPSDHLLPPHLFETLTSDTRLILLNIRPEYFAGKAAAGQPQPVGMIAWGTQHLLGRLLVFEPAAISPGDLQGLAAGIVATILQDGRLPEPGERLQALETRWHARVQAASRPLGKGIMPLRLLPVPAAAKETTRESLEGDQAATGPSSRPANVAETTPDTDLDRLPTEVREKILEQRRLREHVGGSMEMGAFRNWITNAAAGLLVSVFAVTLFIGYWNDSSMEGPKALPKAERLADRPLQAERSPRTATRHFPDRLIERKERRRDGEDAAYEDDLGNEENDFPDMERAEVEEDGAAERSDAIPEGERRPSGFKRNGDDEEVNADADESPESSDLVRD